MERLTETYYDEFGIKHSKIKDDIDRKTYRSYTWTPQEIANDKLAEFEDFMEKNKYNSIIDLQADLAILAVVKLSLDLTEKENQALKNRWDKLKEYLKESYEEFAQYENMEDCASGYKYTLDEMQELEKGE